MDTNFKGMSVRILEAELLAIEIDIEVFMNDDSKQESLNKVNKLKDLLDRYIQASDRLQAYNKLLNMENK
jgi:hypothetical protein